MPTTKEAPAKAAPAKKATKTAAPSSLGDEGAQLFKLRDRKRELEAQIKALDDEAKEIESRLLKKMGDDKLDKFTVTGHGTLSVSSSVVADVKDWSELEKFIHKHKYFQLFQRRVSDTAYRELLEAGKKIPGVEPFTKVRLNVRATS